MWEGRCLSEFFHVITDILGVKASWYYRARYVGIGSCVNTVTIWNRSPYALGWSNRGIRLKRFGVLCHCNEFSSEWSNIYIFFPFCLSQCDISWHYKYYIASIWFLLAWNGSPEHALRMGMEYGQENRNKGDKKMRKKQNKIMGMLKITVKNKLKKQKPIGSDPTWQRTQTRKKTLK